MSDKIIYMDACVFTDYINDGRHAPCFESAMEALRKGKCGILTSMLTITEVAYAATEKKQKALQPDICARIDKLWHPSSGIRVIAVHEFTARDARDLLRESAGEGLSGTGSIDAIHLATAKREHATEFWTVGEKTMNRWNNKLGFEVKNPYTIKDEQPVPAQSSLDLFVEKNGSQETSKARSEA